MYERSDGQAYERIRDGRTNERTSDKRTNERTNERTHDERKNERMKKKRDGPLTFQSKYQGHLLTKGELKDMNDKTIL